MSFPGDVWRGSGDPELADKPDRQEHRGRDGQRDDDGPGGNPGPWKQDDIGAHDSRDGSRGADDGDRRAGVHENMGDAGNHAAGQIERQVSAPTKGVLNVVAEDPQGPHISEQMRETAVKENGRQEAESDDLVVVQARRRVAVADSGIEFTERGGTAPGEFARNGCVLVEG